MRQNENSSRHQQRLRILILTIAALVLVGLACNLPDDLPFPTPAGPGAYVYTSVAQTLVVLEASPPQDGTDTSTNGTQTPQDSDPSVDEGTSQFTPGAVNIYLSENTNCRTGQSSSFKRLTILMKGEEAEVVGRDFTGDYFYIRQPDQPLVFCWLWNAYATPNGPLDSLPVFTTVPTATPEDELE